MKILTVGEKIKISGDTFEILEVQIYKGSVSYGINFKNDGEIWHIFAGIILEDGTVAPLRLSWV